MQPYQQRVIQEQEELAEKASKLYNFLSSSNPSLFLSLSKEDQHLLKQQYIAMKAYEGILSQRIARFT